MRAQIAWGLIALLPSCGGGLAADDASAPIDAAGPRCEAVSYDVDDVSTYDTPVELASAIADARCRRSVACSVPARECAPWRTDLTAWLREPIDLARAATCLRDLAIADCPPRGAVLSVPSCDALGRREAPDGAACADDSFCVSHRCVGTSGTCDGVCTAVSACPTCASDERCDAHHGVCVPARALGEACGDPAPPCGVGAYCSTAPPGAHCVHAPRAGEPCAVEPADGGSFEVCDEGLVCDASHTCVVPTAVEVGDACGPTTEACPGQSDCIGDVCVARATAGAPCDRARQCADGTQCNEAGVCAPMVAPGCACDATTSCPLQFRCAEGRCRALDAIAWPCADGNDCDGLACVRGRCTVQGLGAACSARQPNCDVGHCAVSGVCTAPRARGARCDDDPNACPVPEACIDGTCGIQPWNANVCAP